MRNHRGMDEEDDNHSSKPARLSGCRGSFDVGREYEACRLMRLVGCNGGVNG